VRRLLIAITLTGAVLTGACGGSSSSTTTPATASGGGITVAVKALTFEPDAITIKAGDKVTWKWEDTSAHNVTFASFHSTTMDSGTYEHVFTSTGTFKYHCTLHPTMTGKVKVT
jgi:plastocyanin